MVRFNRRTLVVLAIVITLLTTGGVFTYASPSIFDNSIQDQVTEAKILSTNKIQSTCDDDRHHQSVTDLSKSGGRKLIINETIITDSPSAIISVEMVTKAPGNYVVNVTSDATNASSRNCAGEIQYTVVAAIPNTTTYQITIIHNGQKVRTISSSEEGAGSSGRASGSSD